MGGFFGATSRRNCILDVFFGTDYHSHLGTRRGGMAAWDKELGMQREIHNIQNSPFRTKFEGILDEMKGTAAIVQKKLNATAWNPIFCAENVLIVIISTWRSLTRCARILERFS